MSDVSDPEDEIIEIAPKPTPKPAPQQQKACSARRVPPQKPPGVDKWPAIYTTYLNANRTKAQVQANFQPEHTKIFYLGSFGTETIFC